MVARRRPSAPHRNLRSFRPGPIGRLRERRLHEKAHGETAETLMPSPAVAVYPGASVAEAAWVMALPRLKRLPVTDHEGRLVGVVQRNALLQAPGTRRLDDPP